jgi:hypothetical protein
VDPLVLIGLFFSTLLFGSVGGTAYAVAHGFSTSATIISICIINAIIAALLFGIAGVISARLLKYLGKERKKLEKKRGPLSTLGVGGISFVFGSLWAVIVAYTINVRGASALASIMVGGVLGGLLWTLGSLGIIWFLPNPWILYVVMVCVMGAIVAKKASENWALIKKILRGLRKKKH